MRTDNWWRRRDLWVVVGVYVAVELIFFGVKVRWVPTPWNASFGHEVLDPSFFKHDFFQSFWYLHTQPPLFNLEYGIFDVIGFKGIATFAMVVTTLVVGLGVCLGTYLLALELHLHRRLAVVLAALAVISPSFIVFQWFPFYTLDTQLLVLLLLLFAARYFRTDSWRYAAGAFWCGAGLVLLNPTYQLPFLLVVVGAVVYARRARWRQLLRTAAAPTAIVLAWYIKTAIVFGLFTTSSYFAMNLSHVTVGSAPSSTVQSLVTQHTLSPLALVTPLQPASAFEPTYVAAPHTGKSVLDADASTFSGENLNNDAFVSLGSQYLHADVNFIVHEPGDYLGNVANSMSVWFVPGDRYYWARARPQIASYANKFDGLVGFELSSWKLSRSSIPPPVSPTNLAWSVILVYLLAVIGLPVAYFRYRRRLQLPFAVLGVAWCTIVYTFLWTTFLDYAANNEARLDLASVPLLCSVALVVAVWRAATNRATPAVDVPTGDAVEARTRVRKAPIAVPDW